MYSHLQILSLNECGSMATKYIRNVFEIGQSFGVTLPKDWVNFFNIEKGDKIVIYENGILILIPEKYPDFENKIKEIEKMITNKFLK